MSSAVQKMYELIPNGNNKYIEREHSSINNTQRIIKDITASKYAKKDLEKLFGMTGQDQVKAWCTGEDLSRLLNNTFSKWEHSSNNSIEEACSVDNFKKDILNFVKLIEKENDYISSYVINEGVYSVWIVIKNSTFKENKKYLKSAREYKKEFNCEFELIIFDLEQKEEVLEQLKYIKCYKGFGKNA